jgi:hypothetical protein
VIPAVAVGVRLKRFGNDGWSARRGPRDAHPDW